MRRPTPAVIATGGLHAVAAPAISGAAQRPGKPLSGRAPALVTSKDGPVAKVVEISAKVNSCKRLRTDRAATLRASTAAVKI
jgi:hypothetical protein